MTQKDIKRNNGIRNNNATQEELAWCRGYFIAMKHCEHRSFMKGQYDPLDEVKYCRIFAMAYAQGFVNGKKAAAKKQKRVADNIW